MALIAGIDAGGSKTVCWLATADGRLLGRGEGGPGNFLVSGEEGTKASVKLAVERALESAGLTRAEEIALLTAGVAGVDRDRAALWRSAMEALGSLGVAKEVDIYDDGVVALLGATSGRPGVVVIAGTGSIVLAMNERGERVRCGGWGYILSDEGSGYQIGRAALAELLRMHDGRREVTGLSPMLLGHLGYASAEDVVEAIHGGTLDRTAIARLAPLVAAAADRGDAAAREVLQQAAEDLAEMIVTAVRRAHAGESLPVHYAGGVLTHIERVRFGLEQSLARRHPGLSLRPARFEPAVGALILGLQRQGLFDDAALGNLSRTYDRTSGSNAPGGAV